MTISFVNDSEINPKEIQRYKQFIAWTFLAALLFGSILLFAARSFNAPQLGYSGAVVLGYDICLLASNRFLRRGRIYAAVMTSSIGLLIAAMLLTAYLPIAIPAISILPLMTIAHALPYLPGREIRLLIFASLFIAVIIVAFDVLAAPSINTPVWFSISFRISSFGAALGILLLLLWQYASRLTNMLQQTRAINASLGAYASQLNIANDELKQFASIVSHDLRAPLLNIRGFSQELGYQLEQVKSSTENAQWQNAEVMKKTSAAFNKEIPEALDFINSSVIRMDGYLSALLKLSRMGHRTLEFETVDTEGVVNETLKTLRHQMEKGRAEVQVNPLPRIHADAVSIQQIFGNILNNAVNYLGPARPGRIVVSAQTNLDETIFSIEDNGRGIAKEDYQKVFTPLRRAGRQDVPGEGMGLAYVQTLVRLHRGKIWFESQPDAGTTFFFSISRSLIEGDKNE